MVALFLPACSYWTSCLQWASGLSGPPPCVPIDRRPCLAINRGQMFIGADGWKESRRKGDPSVAPLTESRRPVGAKG